MKKKFKYDHSQKKEKILKARKELDDEINAINERLNSLSANNYIDSQITDQFSSLPILQSTKLALYKNKFHTMTPIQKESLKISLTGRDLIGAAETGTGKTLAFLIPLIETLKKAHWTIDSGLGAIIITPTRDLAAQTFRVLKNLVADDNYNVGLITGGLDIEAEAMNLPRCNIAVATLGRLREHVENTPQFNADSLQILVLDEADRLLATKDFMHDLEVILESIPKSRQTLLFTATATSALKKITRISLQNPERVNLTEKSSSATPDNLAQFYSVVPISQKINALFSFLKTHRGDKIIVFFETRKLARFAYEAFRHLKPGLPLILLTGKQKENTRFAASADFSTKERAALFTTDVCARGIDFPAVNWVIQYDCPFSTDTYIHRVGRTARYFAKGKSLLFLLPSEKNFVKKLLECKVNVQKQKIAGSQLIDIKAELVSILAKFPDCRQLAIKAFITYLQSIQIHQDGEIFQLEPIIAAKDDFAASFGLLQTPVISLTDKKKKKVKLMGPIQPEKTNNLKKVKNELNEDDENVENDDEGDNENESDVGTTYKQEVINEEEEEDLSFLAPVESDWVDEEDETEQKMVPTIIEFLEPGTPIPMQEFLQWRERLSNLLHPPTQAVPKQKYQKIKRRSHDEEVEEEEDKEEEKEEEEKEEPIDVESLLLHELD